MVDYDQLLMHEEAREEDAWRNCMPRLMVE